MGMSREEYWEGTPYLVVSYRTAFKLRQEKENGDAWWAGAYIRQAVQSALSTSLPWFKGKSIGYPKEPHRITPLTKEEKEEQKRKEQEKAIRSLNAWKDAWDRQHG